MSLITTGDGRTMEVTLNAGVATIVAGVNRSRHRIVIQPTTDKTVYLGFSSAVTAANGWPLKPMSGAATFDGEKLEIENYHGGVWAFCADAVTVRVLEVGVLP